MNKLLEFRKANIEKLEKNWSQLENKADYTPNYHIGRQSGFTHFVASEFVNHNNQTGEYVNV